MAFVMTQSPKFGRNFLSNWPNHHPNLHRIGLEVSAGVAIVNRPNYNIRLLSYFDEGDLQTHGRAHLFFNGYSNINFTKILLKKVRDVVFDHMPYGVSNNLL
jgi:hypothetical protein